MLIGVHGGSIGRRGELNKFPTCGNFYSFKSWFPHGCRGDKGVYRCREFLFRLDGKRPKVAPR